MEINECIFSRKGVYTHILAYMHDCIAKIVCYGGGIFRLEAKGTLSTLKMVSCGKYF